MKYEATTLGSRLVGATRSQRMRRENLEKKIMALIITKNHPTFQTLYTNVDGALPSMPIKISNVIPAQLHSNIPLHQPHPILTPT